MSATHCPNCGRFTPTDRMICPYCPLRTRIAQGLGALLAHMIVFVPILAVILWLLWRRRG